jgi:CheY-like chemotaxis protein
MPEGSVILVVDDDLEVREAIADLLGDAGHTIVMARNGREALDALAAGPLPCLILLDMMMPVMDGYEFLERRAQDPTLAAIPVAVLTAQRAPDLARIGKDVRVFTKPISLKELVSAVDEYC